VQKHFKGEQDTSKNLLKVAGVVDLTLPFDPFIWLVVKAA